MAAVSRSLRVLLVEDSDDDAQLVIRELVQGGFTPVVLRVETPDTMRAALEKTWDVILSDYQMPSFSAPAAFAMVRERGLDVPFIIVSGAVGEETAVEAMRTGVHDYLLKGKLARLVPVIDRELREAASRAAQRRMQEQLLVSERLAAVGTLAAGVAHEINNPLTYVNILVGRLISLEAARARDPLAAHRLEMLDEVRDGLRRVERIADDLRTYSRHDDEKQAWSYVDQVLETALRLAGHEIRHRALLVRELEPVPPVRGSNAGLAQVFLNLVLNAAQSMAEGEAHTNQLRVSTRRLGDSRVVIEIADTGTGIPHELLTRIFEPFFTTKRVGEGPGLGLSIARSIVTGLGGELSVHSELGKGSCFRVVLPVADAATVAAAATASAVVARPVPRAIRAAAPRVRILVVDDDPGVNAVVMSLLAGDHDVTTAHSGREALAMLERDPEIDLIVCDLMMPEISGVDLFEALVLVRPSLQGRFLFMTGGAFTRSARDFLDRVAPPLLVKPFTEQALSDAVSQALAGFDRTAAEPAKPVAPKIRQTGEQL